MKKIFSFLIIPVFIVLIFGCHKTVDTPNERNSAVILGYPAVNNYNIASSGIPFWNNALIELDLSKASQSKSFSINLPKPEKSDVKITLGIDQAMFNDNKSNIPNGDSYVIMPESYYKIPNTEIVIPAGQTDTTVTVTFFPDQIDMSKSYVLPLSITNASNVSVNKRLSTVFFHTEKDPFPPYSRTDWTVVDFSSQEASGEGPNNGKVIHAFDNNPGTFWHSKWQGGTDPLPYWFIIDMHTTHELHGISLLPRQGVGSNAGRPKDMVIEGSANGTDWVQVGKITVADNANWQKFQFSQVSSSVRYFRITINSVYGGVSYSNIAEIRLF